MTVLLTGGTGFVGRAVLAQLLASGRPVRALVRDPGRLPAGARASVEAWTGSLTAPETLQGIGAGVEGVVHLAGLVAAKSRSALFAANQEGTRALRAAVDADAPAARWVQVSSLAAAGPALPPGPAADGEPVSDYGRSKLAGEGELADRGNTQVLRPPAVYGPGDRAFLPYFQAVARGRFAPVPSVAGQLFSFVHVDDLAAAICAALEANAVVGPLYPCHPATPSMHEFLAALGEAVGKPPRTCQVPPTLLWVLAAIVTPWRRLTGKPEFLSWDKAHEITAAGWCCDPAEAEASLGWKAAFDLASGLAHTADSYRSTSAI